MQLPEEDRHIITKSELDDRLAVLLGGRGAELLIYGDTSTGASDDLARATGIARAMVCEPDQAALNGLLEHSQRGRAAGRPQGEGFGREGQQFS